MEFNSFDASSFFQEIIGAAAHGNDPRHVMLTRPLGQERELEGLTQIPFASLGNLAEIRSLNMRHHEIETIDSGIQEMRGLTWLDLSDNPLRALPDELAALPELRFLRASDTARIAPHTLYRLSAPGNRMEYEGPYGLTGLPEAYSSLRELLYLRLDGGRIATFPPCIFSMEKLDYLDLSFNLLTEIPEAIGALTELTYLQLSRNNFHVLPESLGRLNKLQRLRLDSLHLYSLPESIGQLESLVSLEICNSILEEIPSSIKYLQRLEHIYLYNTELSDIDKNMLNVFLPGAKVHYSMEEA